MSTDTTIQIRIDSKIKTKAQKAFKGMGIDMSSGIKMFLHQVSVDNCMPFVPSTTKTRAIRKSWDKEYEWVIKHGKGYKNAGEMHANIMRREK